MCALSPTRFAIAFNVRSQGSGHGAPYVMIGMLAPQDEDAEKEEEESLIFSNATEVTTASFRILGSAAQGMIVLVWL